MKIVKDVKTDPTTGKPVLKTDKPVMKGGEKMAIKMNRADLQAERNRLQERLDNATIFERDRIETQLAKVDVQLDKYYDKSKKFSQNTDRRGGTNWQPPNALFYSFVLASLLVLPPFIILTRDETPQSTKFFLMVTVIAGLTMSFTVKASKAMGHR